MHFFDQSCQEKTARSKRNCAQIFRMSSGDFDAGKADGKIILVQATPDPPWLLDPKRFSYAYAKSDATSPAAGVRNTVARRLSCLRPSIRRRRELILATNINRALNAYAKASGTNGPRFRFWWAAYMVFGVVGLLPGTDRCGRWDRKNGATKLGRPSLTSGRAGYRRTHEMDAKCLDGWLQHRRLGKSLEQIYRETLRSEFGCRGYRTTNGTYSYCSPTGSAFPSRDQFRNSLVEQVGLNELRVAVLGPEGVRGTHAPLGKFSEHVSEINQVVEGDAYVVDDVPTGYDGSEHPPIAVATLTCALTGMPVGVGGSPTGENAAAYSTAFWFAAIGAARASKYFGIEISEEEWPSRGLPSRTILDRGPGAIEALAKELDCRELSLSYSGQSKAIAESSHPRTKTLQGQPVRKVSTLSPTEIFQRELARYAANANSDDVSSRATPRTIAAGVLNTPSAHWRYYRDQCRDSSRIVSFDEATRRFLPSVRLKVREDGVGFHFLRYRSDTDLYQALVSKAKRVGVFEVVAHVHPMNVRYVWVDFEGALLELEAYLPVGDSESSLFMSIPQLVTASNTLSSLQSTHRSQKSAARAFFMGLHPSKNPEASQLKKGRRKPAKARRSDATRRLKEVSARED